MRSGRADRRHDTFADTCQHGLLAGAADQLFDIGAHRNAGFGDQLNAVLGDGRYGRGVDDLGVHRHLYGLEYVAARKVDGRRHLEVEHDVGFLGRHQRMYDIGDVAARKIMGLQFVGIETQTGFGALDHRRDDRRGRHLAPAHQDKLQQTDPHARHQCREPQSYGNKIKDKPDRKQAHENYKNDQSTLKIHSFCFYLVVFTMTLKFSNPTTSTSFRGST